MSFANFGLVVVGSRQLDLFVLAGLVCFACGFGDLRFVGY